MWEGVGLGFLSSVYYNLFARYEELETSAFFLLVPFAVVVDTAVFHSNGPTVTKAALVNALLTSAGALTNGVT